MALVHQQSEFTVPTLGERRCPSPLNMSTVVGDGRGDYVWDDARMLYEPRFRANETPSTLAFELAGPREQIYFDPAKTKAAIVTSVKPRSLAILAKL